ncbi:MAG: hypothetical protein HFF38_13080 [Lawsonibacter sp.]|jgi:hypothetical protein|nr:hypothetical protein [Lawsonibacter sp.]
MRKLRICPKCNKRYKSYPAISRDDNKTEICPACGLLEALLSLKSTKEQPYEKARSI